MKIISMETCAAGTTIMARDGSAPLSEDRDPAPPYKISPDTRPYPVCSPAPVAEYRQSPVPKKPDIAVDIKDPAEDECKV